MRANKGWRFVGWDPPFNTEPSDGGQEATIAGAGQSEKVPTTLMFSAPRRPFYIKGTSPATWGPK